MHKHGQIFLFCRVDLERAGKAPGQPWHGNCAALEAAYCRAGLGHWVSSSLRSACSPGKQEKGGEWLVPRPKLAVDCCVRDVVITLPFGCDLGTAQRFTELWAKAFAEVPSRPLACY